MDARRRTLAIALLVLAWSATFAAVEVGLEGAPPVLFAGLRALLGGAVIAVPALLGRRRLALRRTWWPYAVLTLWNVIGFLGLQTVAILELPSGLAAVLIYLQPVLVGLLGAVLLGESFTRPKAVGLLLGFAGIVVVSAGALSGHVSALGVGYAIAAAVAWAVGTVAFKRYSDGLDGWWAVALPFLAGGLLMTGLGVLTEGARIEWSAAFVTALLFAAVVGTGLSWMLWFGLVGSGEASRAASYIFFVPIVSLLIGGAFLHERLGPSLLAGAVLVIAGVHLVNRRSGDRVQ